MWDFCVNFSFSWNVSFVAWRSTYYLLRLLLSLSLSLSKITALRLQTITILTFFFFNLLSDIIMSTTLCTLFDLSVCSWIICLNAYCCKFNHLLVLLVLKLSFNHIFVWLISHRFFLFLLLKKKGLWWPGYIWQIEWLGFFGWHTLLNISPFSYVAFGEVIISGISSFS